MTTIPKQRKYCGVLVGLASIVFGLWMSLNSIVPDADFSARFSVGLLGAGLFMVVATLRDCPWELIVSGLATVAVMGTAFGKYLVVVPDSWQTWFLGVSCLFAAYLTYRTIKSIGVKDGLHKAT